MAWEPTGREPQSASGVSWRNLSSGMRTFVAIDGVLVLGLVVLLVITLVRAGGTGFAVTATGSATEPSAGPTTSAAPHATLATFAAPSRNIACTITADGATCTIASITFTPPPINGCTGPIGHVVTVDATGSAMPCPDGPAPEVAGTDVPVLDYGRSTTVHGYTCVSSTAAMTCWNDVTGQGFTVARQSYSLKDPPRN